MQEKSNPNSRSGSWPSCPGLYRACRAKPRGDCFDFTECLTPPRKYCPYRHLFDWSFRFYCHHPDNRRIVEQTNKGRGKFTSSSL